MNYMMLFQDCSFPRVQNFYVSDRIRAIEESLIIQEKDANRSNFFTCLARHDQAFTSLDKILTHKGPLKFLNGVEVSNKNFPRISFTWRILIILESPWSSFCASSSLHTLGSLEHTGLDRGQAVDKCQDLLSSSLKYHWLIRPNLPLLDASTLDFTIQICTNGRPTRTAGCY